MKVSELKKILEQSKFGRAPCYEDEEVLIRLKEPSLGWVAAEPVESAYFGFDWDNNRFLLCPKKSLVRLKEKEALWQCASDFIYGLSQERTPKGNPTSLAKHAQKIIDRAKLKGE